MPVSNVIRTLAIVRRMADGEPLFLPNGDVLALGADLTIGYAVEQAPGDWRISPLATLALVAFDALLERHHITGDV